MNKKRRNTIEKALEEIKRLKDVIEQCIDDEEDAYSNLPESIQYSERGESMQEIVEYLEYADSSLDEAIDNINEALEIE